MVIAPAATAAAQNIGHTSRMAMTPARPLSFVLCAKRQPATPIRNLRLAPSSDLPLTTRSARNLAACDYLVVMLKNAFKVQFEGCGCGRSSTGQWLGHSAEIKALGTQELLALGRTTERSPDKHWVARYMPRFVQSGPQPCEGRVDATRAFSRHCRLSSAFGHSGVSD
jgi:hypothetical protein